MQEISEAMATRTADSSTNASETLSPENSSSFRGDSFSSYSNEAEDTFVLQLEESSRHLNSFPAILHKHELEHLQLGRKKTEYGEVEVFGAEKYFKEGLDEEIPKIDNGSGERCLKNKDDSLETGSPRPKTQTGSGRVPSKLSWNSRSSLLHVSRNQEQSRKVNNNRVWSFLAGLGCNCSCRGKESVNVDNYTDESKAKATSQNGNVSEFKKYYSSTFLKDRQSKRSVEAGCVLNAPDDVGFPVFDSKAGIANKLHLQEGEEECTKRKSLEVFGSPIMTKGEKSLSPGRRIAMLSWSAIRPRELETEIPANSNQQCNDTDSDASSDLFEIESFSTNANMDLVRPASFVLSSCITATTCYATSEASIELSTVKASNAYNVSVMSEAKELKTTANKASQIAVLDDENIANKEMPKWLPSIPSACKSHKAVRVAGEANQTSNKELTSAAATKDSSH